MMLKLHEKCVFIGQKDRCNIYLTNQQLGMNDGRI